jgi:hypothetical protein
VFIYLSLLEIKSSAEEEQKPNLRTEQMQRTWQNKKKKDQKRKRKL